MAAWFSMSNVYFKLYLIAGATYCWFKQIHFGFQGLLFSIWYCILFYIHYQFDLHKELMQPLINNVAKYQEANRAVYTVITFPFLCAVMFGDWGHRICLLIRALVLITGESKLRSEVWLLLEFCIKSLKRSICFEGIICNNMH